MAPSLEAIRDESGAIAGAATGDHPTMCERRKVRKLVG